VNPDPDLDPDPSPHETPMTLNPSLPRALVLALSLAACGGSDDEGPTAGTCDWTQVATRRTCLEQSGDPLDVARQRATCLANEGTWIADACPVTADLIGCCTYELGLSFRECFYERPERAYDPQSVCTSTTFNGVPGTWTPAPPG
jgi:hypothetical protein